MNVHKKSILSEVLGKELPLNVSLAAYRTFDKYGGLDRYLLRSPLHKLDYGLSRDLRSSMEITLLNSPATAKRLGLDDVLKRIQAPEETTRLRAIEMRRWEAEEQAREEGSSPLRRIHFLTAPRYLYQPVGTLADGRVVQRRLKPSERALLTREQRAEQDAVNQASFEAAEALALTTPPPILVFPKPRDERRAARDAAEGGPLPENVVALAPPPRPSTLLPGEVFTPARKASYKFPFTIPMLPRAKKDTTNNAKEAASASTQEEPSPAFKEAVRTKEARGGRAKEQKQKKKNAQ